MVGRTGFWRLGGVTKRHELTRMRGRMGWLDLLCRTTSSAWTRNTCRMRQSPLQYNGLSSEVVHCAKCHVVRAHDLLLFLGIFNRKDPSQVGYVKMTMTEASFVAFRAVSCLCFTNSRSSSQAACSGCGALCDANRISRGTVCYFVIPCSVWAVLERRLCMLWFSGNWHLLCFPVVGERKN